MFQISHTQNRVNHDTQGGKREKGGFSRVGNITLHCIIPRRSPVGLAVSPDIMTIRGTNERRKEERKREEDDDALEKRSARRRRRARKRPLSSIHPIPTSIASCFERKPRRSRKANDSACITIGQTRLNSRREEDEVITSISGRNENIPLLLLSSLLQVGSFACLGPYSFHLR